MNKFKMAILLNLPLALLSQSNDIESFQALRSVGDIPQEFTISWADKYFENPTELDRESVEIGNVSMEEFWIDQNHSIDVLLSSGRFSYGDPLTIYINEVADKVLGHKPELRSQLRFYLYRDPSANAFCVADGLIGINCGLLANIKSEAELAFVIAHEASHYTEEHIFEEYFEVEFEESDELDALKAVESRIKRSRKQELEADEEGLELFLASAFDTAAVPSALITL